MQAVHVLVCAVELVLSHFPESLLGPLFYDSHCSHQKISCILLREDMPASSIPPALTITFLSFIFTREIQPKSPHLDILLYDNPSWP